VQLNSTELNLTQRIGRAIRWRENHTPKIVILVAKDTADEKWYYSATANFNKSRIKEYYVRAQATAIGDS
jgi:ERCC4-related helicase